MDDIIPLYKGLEVIDLTAVWISIGNIRMFGGLLTVMKIAKNTRPDAISTKRMR